MPAGADMPRLGRSLGRLAVCYAAACGDGRGDVIMWIIINPLNKEDMKKYVCDVCGYVYDPEVGDPDNGIAPGTAFEDIPEDWVCPLCGVGKSDFSVEE